MARNRHGIHVASRHAAQKKTAPSKYQARNAAWRELETLMDDNGDLELYFRLYDHRRTWARAPKPEDLALAVEAGKPLSLRKAAEARWNQHVIDRARDQSRPARRA
jgi:hypothetical protein